MFPHFPHSAQMGSNAPQSILTVSNPVSVKPVTPVTIKPFEQVTPNQLYGPFAQIPFFGPFNCNCMTTNNCNCDCKKN